MNLCSSDGQNMASNVVDSKRNDHLEFPFSKDIVRLLVSAIGNKNSTVERNVLEPIGSWTAFLKSILNVKTPKAFLE